MIRLVIFVNRHACLGLSRRGLLKTPTSSSSTPDRKSLSPSFPHPDHLHRRSRIFSPGGSQRVSLEPRDSGPSDVRPLGPTSTVRAPTRDRTESRRGDGSGTPENLSARSPEGPGVPATLISASASRTCGSPAPVRDPVPSFLCLSTVKERSHGSPSSEFKVISEAGSLRS